MARVSVMVGLGILSFTLLATFATAPVFASSPGTQGQPNQSCQAVFPTGPFSPNGFNTAGFAHAGTVYAGTGENTETPANSHAVSQYDVACFQVAHH